MPEDAVFRPMRHEEAELLNQMTMDGVRHWGHHERHPDAVAGLEATLPDIEGYASMTVRVLDSADGPIGFYSLADHGDHVELYQMFLRPDLIGHGFGRRLWDDAVAVAASMSDRMLIMADPESVGFYEAMGAELVENVEIAPGFSLGRMWFDLPDG